MKKKEKKTKTQSHNSFIGKFEKILFFSLCVFCLFFVGCTAHDPAVSDEYFVRYGYEYDPLSDSIQRSFGVFFTISDEDGSADIEKIIVSSEADQLSWEINQYNWTFVKVDDNKAIIGASNLIAYQDFDGGKFIATIIDYSGKAVIREISLQNIDFLTKDELKDRGLFPLVKIENKKISASGYTGQISMVLYHNTSNYSLELDKNNIVFDYTVISAFVYVYDTQTNTYLRLGPYFASQDK